MKKIHYCDMDALGSVMDSVLQNPVLRRGMKKATLFKFWAKIAGKKFENVSRIESLNSRNGKAVLTVACSNAAVTSELLMYKTQLLKKMNTYANPLGIEIDDINFSHKIWKQETSEPTFEGNVTVLTENPYKEDLTGFDAEKIKISDEEISAIKENISNNKALSSDQQERLLNSIIYDIKVQKFLHKD